MSAETNPYATPAAVVDDVVTDADPEAERIRKEHINHEASIKSIGLLYYFTAALGFLGALLSALAMIKNPQIGGNLLTALFSLGISVVLAYLGYGVRKLKPSVRIPVVLVSSIGLFSFPFGTLIYSYVLWLILSKKGRFILSKEYAAIVAATPQVMYRPASFWKVLLIAIGLIALLAAGAMLYAK